ncbi:MAG: hypothetical protein M1814_000331 [Vezdaea aestivalis]|nr:MAG: hypothetical protein M1814_000331 [Vezdaea aestivalis]
MSYPPQRPLTSHLRHTSISGSQSSAGQSQALIARINEKRAELESLRELQELSAGLAQQMQVLEDKLGTLTDGTEAVAAVLSNWHNVLRAINMASMKIPVANADAPKSISTPDVSLPQTLVRIPVDHILPDIDDPTGKEKTTPPG